MRRSRTGSGLARSFIAGAVLVPTASLLFSAGLDRKTVLEDASVAAQETVFAQEIDGALLQEIRSVLHYSYRPFVVLYMSPTCPFCLKELQTWENDWRQRSQVLEQIDIILIAPYSSNDLVQAYGLDGMQHMDDPDGRIKNALKVRGTPTALYIDSDGKVLKRLLGVAPIDITRNAIKSLSER